MLMKSRLKGIELTLVRQAFNGYQIRIAHLNRKKQTRPDGLSIQLNGTSAANPMLAADMGTGQGEVIAEKIHQEFPRLNFALIGRFIHAQANDALGHVARPMESRALWAALDSARAVSTLAAWTRYSADA